MNDFTEPCLEPVQDIQPDAHATQPYPQIPAEAPYEERIHIITKKPKKQGKRGIFFALALFCSLLGSIAGGCAVLFAQQTLIPEQPAAEVTEPDIAYLLQGSRESTVLEIVSIDTGREMTAAEVYAANAGSTVGITTSVTTNYFGFQTTSAASGSGFIVTSDGYIITNYHVVEDSDSITVSLYSGESYEAAMIAYDESNDLAILKIEAEGLTPVILGDSDNLNVGDPVVAIGNPLGELTFSLTAGNISAKDRKVTMSSNLTMNLLQTDCAINSGNSGGALFNMYGEVIGVTNAKYSSSSSSEASIDNIGFAIPINDIRSIVESILEKGYYSKPYLGVSVTDVSREYQIYGLPQGAAVQSVAADSPAQDAGLHSGDIITKVGQTEITGRTSLGEAIECCQIGEEVSLTVYRQGQTLTLAVTVGEQIQSIETQKQESTSSGYSGNFPWGRG